MNVHPQHACKNGEKSMLNQMFCNFYCINGFPSKVYLLSEGFFNPKIMCANYSHLTAMLSEADIYVHDKAFFIDKKILSHLPTQTMEERVLTKSFSFSICSLFFFLEF